MDLLFRLCFIPFVAIARIDKTSAIIFASASMRSAVGGASVYVLMRLKKLSILSKSSTSLSRLAIVFFAACQRRIDHDVYRGSSKKTHYEKDADPSKDDRGRGEYLAVNVRGRTSNGGRYCSPPCLLPGQG
jgi:hypothetical protein